MEVNNGTEWLHLGGDINTFLPIVTEHSQTAATSDLSLEQALNMVKEKMETVPSHIGKCRAEFLTKPWHLDLLLAVHI